MRVTKFYISSILEEIAGMLIGISENVTAGNRKSVSQEQMEDFIVVYRKRAGRHSQTTIHA